MAMIIIVTIATIVMSKIIEKCCKQKMDISTYLMKKKENKTWKFQILTL